MFDLKKNLPFLVGFVVGCVVGYKLGKASLKRTSCEMDIPEDTNQPKEETFKQTRDEPKKDSLKKKEMESYESIIDESGYSLNDDDLCIITEDEFGTIDDYSVITLEYYADSVLADDSDFVMDPESCVGSEALKRFEDPDVDQVLVRNHKLKVDYEVLRSLQRFDEIPRFEEG